MLLYVNRSCYVLLRKAYKILYVKKIGKKYINKCQ